jgi:hypothetical protein
MGLRQGRRGDGLTTGQEGQEMDVRLGRSLAGGVMDVRQGRRGDGRAAGQEGPGSDWQSGQWWWRFQCKGRNSD